MEKDRLEMEKLTVHRGAGKKVAPPIRSFPRDIGPVTVPSIANKKLPVFLEIFVKKVFIQKGSDRLGIRSQIPQKRVGYLLPAAEKGSFIKRRDLLQKSPALLRVLLQKSSE